MFSHYSREDCRQSRYERYSGVVREPKMKNRILCASGLAAALCLGGCTAASPLGPPASSHQSVSDRSEIVAAQISELATEYARDYGFNGALMVAHGDDVLVSDGFGLADSERQLPNTPSTRFRLGSVSKQITATAILMEQERGTLTIDGLICEFVEPCPTSWAEVRVRHLLIHSSGIPNITDLPGFADMIGAPSTPAETMSFFAGEPLDFAPGDGVSYSSSGYIVLGIILEQASGRSYEQYVQTEIFDPLGMTNSGYEHDGDGLAVGYASEGVPADHIDMSVPYAAGALYSTVEDLHRWDRAVAEGRLLPPTALSDGAQGSPPSELAGFVYGFGVLVGESREHRKVFHDGEINGFMSYFATYPDDDYSVAILTNREDRRYRALAKAIEGVLFHQGP